MARPLRLEFEGAIYHVTARGDRREPIFQDDSDRNMLLAIADASGLSVSRVSRLISLDEAKGKI